MNRQFLKRLMVKGTVAYVAVFSLVLMVAMPAVALIAARNSVNSRSIINGQVTYRDIGKNAVRTSKIASKAVRYGKIANKAVRANHIKSSAVRTNHIKNGTILNADISGGAAISASKINRAGLNADLLDGSHSSAFAGAGHDHDSDYVGVTGLQSIDGTLTVSELKYDSAKMKKLSIIGAAFKPEISGEGYVINNTNGTIYSTSAGTRYFHAPVNLPDGAIVTELRYNILNSYGGFDSEATLIRRGAGSMATVLAPPSTPTWRIYNDQTINSATIDNDNFYFVRLKLNGTGGAGVHAGGVVITYGVGSP